MLQYLQEKLRNGLNHVRANFYKYLVFAGLEGFSYYLFSIDWKIIAGIIAGGTAGMFLLELTEDENPQNPYDRKRNIPGSLAFLIIPILVMICAGELTFNLPFGLSYATVAAILEAIVRIGMRSAQSLE